MGCDYCDEEKGIKTIYHKIYGDRSRIAYQTEHFNIFPCMGQLREGHLLIASKEHIQAMGMLDKECLGELEQEILRIQKFYRKAYNKNMLFFEHGVLSDNGDNGGCGIYHMHLHMLPVTNSEFSQVLAHVRGRETNQVYAAQKLEDCQACIIEKQTYVFFGLFDEKQNKNMYIVKNEKNYFESQYMRRVVCSVFGKEEWNWKKITCKEDVFFKTLEKSRAALQAL